MRMANIVTAAQVNTTKQTIRDLSVRIDVLNYDYSAGGSLSGNVIDGNISINANSDIRRTLSISTIVTDQINIDVNSTLWFDKYIQVYVGVDDQNTGAIVWTNMGIYIINTPTYAYDAETFTLSFEAVDLMGMLTGLRKGNLLYEYFIPHGSNVKEVMTAVLEEAGFTKYIISECTNIDGSIQEVPYDMNFDLGSTWYNILDSLRQILPQYQIYFDVDGVFHYELLPLTNEEPVRVDDTIWKENVLGETVNIDFQSVKNYVRVYGTTHDASFYPASTTVSGNIITFDVAELTDSTLYDYAMIGFVLPQSVVSQNYNIRAKLKNGTDRKIVDSTGGGINKLDADEYYTIMYQQTKNNWLLLGHYQAQGEWKEDNPDSPFYAGNTDITHWSKDAPMGFEYQVSGVPYRTIYLGVNQYVDLTNERVGFKIAESGGSYPNEAGQTYSAYLANISINGTGYPINVDGSTSKLVTYTVGKTYYVENRNGTWYWMGETTAQSTFGVVPIVLFGGDYDNIMSDELATERARWEIYQRCRLNDAISIESVPIYWLDVGWKVEYTPLGGTVTNQYMVDSASVNLANNGTQSITLSRFFPYYEST